MQLTKKQIKFLNKVCYGKWTLNENGEVDVDGGVSMSSITLTEIPVKFGRVQDHFDCSGDNLTTLKNCPDSVGGNFWCYSTNLTDYFKSIKEEDFPLWDKLHWSWVLEEYPFLVNICKKYLDREYFNEYLNLYPKTKEFYIDDNIVVSDSKSLTKKQIKFLNTVCCGNRWTLNENGEVDVDGWVNMSNMKLTEIPVKFGRVEDWFDCSVNKLTTLKNCPTYIGGNFWCQGNNLTEYFKNIKEEDFPHWDKLRWAWMLEECPFLVNIAKNYCDREYFKIFLNRFPKTKEFYIDDNESLTQEQIKFLNNVCGEDGWKLNSNGEVDVIRSVVINDTDITEIPVKFGKVNGGFYCHNNKNLTTLNNLPTRLILELSIQGNNLTDYFRNIKDEDFKFWDKLDWMKLLPQYPFLINKVRKYKSEDFLQECTYKLPIVREYLIDEPEKVEGVSKNYIKIESGFLTLNELPIVRGYLMDEPEKVEVGSKNYIKIENGFLTLNVNQNKIEIPITEKTNFNLNF
jgi:hypothetical protein